MPLLTFVAVTAHLLLGAVWLGAMAYSIGVVQPKLLAFHGDPVSAENVATYVAAGARWKVVGVIGALAASGAVLVAVAISDGLPSDWWWLVVCAKLVLLGAASVIFWRVSWHMWPRRVFAQASEVAAHQAAFRRAGYSLIVLVASASVLGVALRWLR